MQQGGEKVASSGFRVEGIMHESVGSFLNPKSM